MADFGINVVELSGAATADLTQTLLVALNSNIQSHATYSVYTYISDQ